jgi:hypothetical protein
MCRAGGLSLGDSMYNDKRKQKCLWPTLLLLLLGLIVAQTGHAQHRDYRTPPEWDGTVKGVGAGIATFGVGYGVCMAVTAGGCGPIAIAGGLLSGIGGALVTGPTPSVPNPPTQPWQMPDYSSNLNIPDAPPPQPSAVPFAGGTGSAFGGEIGGSTGGDAYQGDWGGGYDGTGDGGGAVTTKKERMAHPVAAPLRAFSHGARGVLARVDWKSSATSTAFNQVQASLIQRYLGPPTKPLPPIRVVGRTPPTKCFCGQKPVRTR